jgi:peptidylprolyl isomerase
MGRSWVWLVALAASGALVLGACGSAGDGGAATSAPPTTQAAAASQSPTSQSPTSAASASNEAAVLAEIEKRGKPTVTVPAQPATKLEIKDLIAGTGETVKPSATVTAHYVGVGQLSKQQFDSSWDRGQPTQFPLDQVIPGWQAGIPGMKVGGRRELIIPGALAYGTSPPQGSGIQPNETLVFVIDLVSVQNP